MLSSVASHLGIALAVFSVSPGLLTPAAIASIGLLAGSYAYVSLVLFPLLLKLPPHLAQEFLSSWLVQNSKYLGKCVIYTFVLHVLSSLHSNLMLFVPSFLISMIGIWSLFDSNYVSKIKILSIPAKSKSISPVSVLKTKVKPSSAAERESDARDLHDDLDILGVTEPTSDVKKGLLKEQKKEKEKIVEELRYQLLSYGSVFHSRFHLSAACLALSLFINSSYYDVFK